MNRSQLIDALADRAGVTKADAGSVLDAFSEVLQEAVKSGDKVQLPGLLTVDTVHRAAREGRNPQTGESLQIAARMAVRVTPGSQLKKAAESLPVSA